MTFHERRQHAIECFDEGDYACAVSLSRQLLKEAPDEGHLWQVCGLACWRLNEFAAALEAFEEATALVPLLPEAQYALAACYVRANLPDLACLIYEHLGDVVEETSVLAAVATRLGALGRHESALYVCRRIAGLDPGHHAAFFGIAYYMQRLGHPPQALLGPLVAAFQLAPEVLHYRVNLGLAWSDAGNRLQAYDILKPVAAEAIRCPCCVRRMKAVFDSMGDSGRSLIFSVRLSCLLQ